jgi:oligopeptide/dipeptide ABC transporter ATP-binding protein
MMSPDVESAPLLEVRDLKVAFPLRRGLIIERKVGEVKAVDGVTFSVARGETLGLVGESGCGKSTTGRAIIRLLRPTSGSVHFDGVDLASLDSASLRRVRTRIQMIYQDPYSSLNPRMTAGEIVGEPLAIQGLGTRREQRGRVLHLMATVGLDQRLADRYPHEFSGGQRQRIGVARALALNPALVLADEPVSALDVSIQAQILNLLEELQSTLHLTYLFIAHDLSVVRHISDRIAVMYLGRIVELASSTDLHREPLHPYSVALLSAVPVPDPAVEARRRRIILKGDVPSPADPPPGCHFHTRCWLRERLGNPARCAEVDPPLRVMAKGHEVACHFAEEVRGSAELAHATGAPPPTEPAQPAPPGAGPAATTMPPNG